MNILPEKLRENLLETRLIYLLIAINLVGTGFGFYYHIPQLMNTDPLLWVFVPDSPVATFAFALSLIFYVKEKRERALETFAFVTNFTYGIWTPLVLLIYSAGFLEVTSFPMYIFLIFSHLGMALQAFLVLDYSFFSSQGFTVAAFFTITDNLVDYTLGTHSILYTNGQTELPAAAIALTLTFLGLLIYLSEVGPEPHQLSDLLPRLS